MRPLRPWRPVPRIFRSGTTPPACLALRFNRLCSCSAAQITLSTTHALQAQRTSDRGLGKGLQGETAQRRSERKDERTGESQGPPDHRIIGTNQSLWTHHPSSPGSPLFLPAGAHIFQKLVEFLRAQYPAYGFQEVLTPMLYKQSLWEQSGHWVNYKDDMFMVTGGNEGNGMEKEEYGLKPMNCPGHCLLFASRRHSYRDLPIRYADFSPLHRDEISGALSGLTRVRRFHQDDGHIFCRPNQIQTEVKDQLQFLEMVYDVFGLKIYKIVLSTRPEEVYIGKVEEWESAERQLKDALDNTKMQWTINPGDGAFYGPKIDVIVRDSDKKEHQTATIQLDFQLPKRFELTYASAEEGVDEQPVMIHRAIFGSLERFIALLTEHYNGRWPFWLSPNQVTVLTVSDNPEVVKYAEDIATKLRQTEPQVRRHLNSPSFSVDIDSSGDSIGKKVARAKVSNGPRHNVICVVGEKNIKSNMLDLDLSGMPRLGNLWDDLEKLQPYSQKIAEEKRRTSDANVKDLSKISISPDVCVKLMKRWNKYYL